MHRTEIAIDSFILPEIKLIGCRTTAIAIIESLNSVRVSSSAKIPTC
jgi:hypothetical protein